MIHSMTKGDPMYDFWAKYLTEDYLGRRKLLQKLSLKDDFDTNLLLKFPNKELLEHYIISLLQGYFDDLVEVCRDKL